MNCLFCKRPEAFTVELHLWDAQEQRARMLLPQGVCVAHRESAVPHPLNTRGMFYEIFPELRLPVEKLVQLHQSRFAAVKSLNYTSGMTFFAYDSLEGGMARAARSGMIDTKKAETHAPTIVIEKVALEDFDEAVEASKDGV